MPDQAVDTLLRRITAFTGNYGSGKTEVAVNVTFGLAATPPVTIVDLDIVNPYFRCREAVTELEAAGVEVIVPRGEHFASELPIILPEVRGVISRPGGRVVLDVGGDDVGARVLSAFAALLAAAEADLLMVLNSRRPFTDSVAGALKIVREIEAASRLRVTGLVANTHLMEETTLEMLDEGVALAEDVGRALGVPLRFVAAMAPLATEARARFSYPVLAMERRMLPPWISPLRQGRDRFRQIGLDTPPRG